MLQNIHIAAYEQNLFEIACDNIFKQHAELLPDLSSITIFLPNQLSQKTFREKLMQHAIKHDWYAILPPKLTTLRSWVLENYTGNKPLLSQYARELMLVDAIKKQPSIFLQANPWVIANELLSFFDAMQLNNIQLDNLQNNNLYNDSDKSQNNDALYTLSEEAKLVTTLWHAWKEQLKDDYFIDSTQAYTDTLDNLNISKQNIFYAIGIEKLCQYEVTLLNKMQRESYLYILLHASTLELFTKPDEAIKLLLDKNTKINLSSEKNTSNYSKYLDFVFLADKLSLKERATAFNQICPSSPIKNRIKLFKANSFEQHVTAIDIKIRCYLLAKKKNIGVITSDRKLVRRLRAILEHANIQVNDLGGWALATTSAVVVIEYWLQFIEEGYSTTILLSLLKSPFFPIKIDSGLHENAINLLERDVILPTRTHRGLHILRDILEQRQSHDDVIETELYDYLYELLDVIETSTQALAKLLKSNKITLQQFFVTLTNSLKTLGIYTTLNNDIAGKQLLNLLEIQISQLKHIENNLNWHECRRFFARILDQQNFKPIPINSNVTFCSLEQSRLLEFDAIVIASASKDYLPGTASNYIFFNESIRNELGLTTWKDENAICLHQFRCLLDVTDEILITSEFERDDNQIRPSPWLEAIETFHKLAYDEDLLDQKLINLACTNSAIIKNQQETTLPNLTKQPSPLLHEDNKPNKISISQYQQLVTCPYQFFAYTCLNLSKTEELQEDLAKKDYGSLVHECIRAFFADIPLLPGPFKDAVTAENRKHAEALLAEISDAVFEKHSQLNFNNILWLQYWKNLIPRFLDWEINRQANFIPEKHEYVAQLEISENLLLKGQIDRIDKSNETFSIIDYKTGSTPRRKEVTAGEKVQLPSYALLVNNCTQVEFVNIGKDHTVKSETVIKDKELQDLVQLHQNRLKEFSKQLNNEVQLPALSEDESCDWCDAKGLCRKEYWQT